MATTKIRRRRRRHYTYMGGSSCSASTHSRSPRPRWCIRRSVGSPTLAHMATTCGGWTSIRRLSPPSCWNGVPLFARPLFLPTNGLPAGVRTNAFAEYLQHTIPGLKRISRETCVRCRPCRGSKMGGSRFSAPCVPQLHWTPWGSLVKHTLRDSLMQDQPD